MNTRTFTKLENELFKGLQIRGYKILKSETFDLETSKTYSVSFFVEKDEELTRFSLCITNDLITQCFNSGAIVYYNI